MKTFLIFLFGIGTISAAYSQKQEACMQNIILVDSLVNAGNFTDAVAPWTEARTKCPAASLKIYTAGESILQYQIEMAATADKELIVRELLALYDQQIKFFPQSAARNNLKKAIALNSISPAGSDEIYAMYDRAFNGNPETFDDPNALYQYYEMYFNKYKAGDKTITTDMLLARQDLVDQRIAAAAETASPDDIKSLHRAAAGIDALLAPVTSCESLLSHYESIFDTRKANSAWLENAAARLLSRGCVSSPFFGKVAAAAYDLHPTETSAYNLGTAALRSGKRDEAAKFYDISATLNPNPIKKAATYYMIATTVYGISNKVQAKDYAKKAIALNPSMGKAYMFLAQLYANSGSDCGNSAFEQKAVYWLAAEMATKAGEVDPNLRKTGSDKTAQTYLAKAPTEAEIKQQKKLGKQLTIGCWINETVNIPKR